MGGLEHLVQIPLTGNKASRRMSCLIKQDTDRTRICLRWAISYRNRHRIQFCLYFTHRCIANGIQQFSSLAGFLSGSVFAFISFLK